MNRADLQKLANTRIRESRILFDAGEHSGAYYLAGYAVECALKSSFSRGVKRYDFPDKRGTNDVYTHDLGKLVVSCNLSPELQAAKQTSARFRSSWDVVCKWSEESRYSNWGKADAEAILDAITGKDGVLPWIKRHW